MRKSQVELLIHKRSDQLLGLFPMTKKMLLERIELMPTGLYIETHEGYMYPVKAMTYALVNAYIDENDLEKIYKYYLKEVKPHINDQG